MKRLHILIVEDEPLIAMDLQAQLEEFGHVVIGPAATLEEAQVFAEAERLDCALLDVDLDGDLVFPVADRLGGRGLPYLFITGYSRAALPERFSAVPRLAKPVDHDHLRGAIDRLFPRGHVAP